MATARVPDDYPIILLGPYKKASLTVQVMPVNLYWL